MVYESAQNSFFSFFNDFLALFKGAVIGDLVLKTKFFEYFGSYFYEK